MKTMLLVGANSPKPPRLPPPFHDCPRCPKTICCWSPFASHHPSPQSASQPAPFQPTAAQHLHSSLISLLLRSNKQDSTRAAYQLTPGQELSSDLRCLESVHQGAWCDSLLGLLFRGAQKAAAWDSPGWLPCGWVVEHRQRNQGAKRDPRTDSYLGFPLCSSVTAKLPSD